MKQIFGLVLLCVLLVEGCALRSGGGDRPSSYRNEEYVFTMSLPTGWREHKLLSREAMEQVRSGEKEGLAVAFVGEEKVDPLGLSLAIIFLSADPKYQDPSERQRHIDRIKEAMAGDPRDEIYRAKEASFSGQPAVEVAACTAYEERQGNGCNIVHHYVEIFAPQARIRIQFTVWKELYPKYKDEIDRSLGEYRDFSSDSPPADSPVSEERYRSSGASLGYRWEV